MFNPLPGLNVRIRPVEEGLSFPALVVGFDSQGKEGFDDTRDRYNVRSKGFFLAASKNFEFAGYLSIHGGVNYSLEGESDERGLDVFAGLEKTVGSAISVVLEYNGDGGVGNSGKGYLNAGLRWSVGGGFTIGLDLKDLTRNDDHVTVGNRSVRIEFLKPL
jgi:hypothetical protein